MRTWVLAKKTIVSSTTLAQVVAYLSHDTSWGHLINNLFFCMCLIAPDKFDQGGTNLQHPTYQVISSNR